MVAGLPPDLCSDVYSHSCQIVPFLSVFSPQKYGIEKEGERERESGSYIELRRKRENK